MKPRKMGSVFRPRYKDKRTGQTKTASTWSIRYYVHGRMFQEQTHSAKRTDAEKMLRARLAAIEQGRPVGPDIEKTCFRDLSSMLLTDYRVNERRSLDRVERSLQHLEGFFGDARATEITEDRIAAYVARRKDEDHAENATINRELAALKRAFRLAERAQKVGRRPYIAMLKENNVRKGFFEPEQFRSVVAHLPEDLRPVAEAAHVTGWRVASEILTRQWKHVDFGSGWLRLEPGETKNGEGRMFPMTPALRAVLEHQRERTTALEQAEGRIIPWLFHRSGKPIKSFRGAWKTACRLAGVPGRYAHDFRRTAVRNLERAGVPRSTAMKIVGHKTESIYRRYAIVDEAMMREGADKLAVLHEAQRMMSASGPDKFGTSQTVSSGSAIRRG